MVVRGIVVVVVNLVVQDARNAVIRIKTAKASFFMAHLLSFEQYITRLCENREYAFDLAVATADDQQPSFGERDVAAAAIGNAKRIGGA